MLEADEQAVICDLAETYHVFDLESLPVTTVAILACGLGENSRIMKKLRGAKVTDEKYLLANIADALNLLVWQRTKDGRKNRNRPHSFVADLKGEPETKVRKVTAFDTPEEFMKERQRLLDRSKDHG